MIMFCEDCDCDVVVYGSLVADDEIVIEDQEGHEEHDLSWKGWG